MLRNSSAFTLLEVMVSLLLLFTSMSVAFPIFQSVYLEEKTLQQKDTALQLLSNELNQWILVDHLFPPEVVIRDKTYQLTWNVENDEMKLCIHWVGANGRDYVECGGAKK